MPKVNDVILNRIDKSKVADPIKYFLKEMLSMQLQSISEGTGRWKFGKEFENLLYETAAKMRKPKK